MTESWAMDAVRGVFATIDKAIYSLISAVYEILLQIAKINVFGPDAIKDMATKIYTLLGIIMLFKITFSFITYLVDPDSFSDKSKGVQKIIANVLIVLALIIITPTAFNKLYEAQNAILNDQLIPKLILGTTDSALSRAYKISERCPNTAYAETDGDYISLLVFSPFYQVEEARNSDLKDLEDYCAIGTEGQVYYGSVSRYLNGKIFNSAPKNWDDIYIIDYKFFVSTAVGIVVLLILVSFCIDFANRSIQLGFLQLIAPVPIISYVDPKSGKDGMFKKWGKEVLRTWGSLFVRLAALFLAIYIIKLVASTNILAGVQKYKMWVLLFIIIGALIFAKKLPKLIESILGVKIDGGLTLNPMKKIRDNALGGKAVTGALKGGAALAVGAGLGSLANIASFVSNAKKDGLMKALTGETDPNSVRGGFRAAGTMFGLLGGGFSAGMRGAYGAFKNDKFGKSLMGGLKTSVTNRDNRDKDQDINYSIVTKGMDKLRGMAGIKSEAKKMSEKAQSDVSRLQALQNNISFRQQGVMNGLSVDAQSALTNITYKEEMDPQTNQKVRIYSLLDAMGNEVRIGDEQELRTRFSNNEYGDITNPNAAIQWVNYQADKNALDKKIFGAMKIQKRYAENDAKAQQK